jgi:hypothetical protein
VTQKPCQRGCKGRDITSSSKICQLCSTAQEGFWNLSNDLVQSPVERLGHTLEIFEASEEPNKTMGVKKAPNLFKYSSDELSSYSKSLIEKGVVTFLGGEYYLLWSLLIAYIKCSSYILYSFM